MNEDHQWIRAVMAFSAEVEGLPRLDERGPMERSWYTVTRRGSWQENYRMIQQIEPMRGGVLVASAHCARAAQVVAWLAKLDRATMALHMAEEIMQRAAERMIIQHVFDHDTAFDITQAFAVDARNMALVVAVSDVPGPLKGRAAQHWISEAWRVWRQGFIRIGHVAYPDGSEKYAVIGGYPVEGAD